MPNPFLPLWEYIPDGEPRVFGNRVYVYGSHDKACSDKFCDHKLKAWSASLENLNDWACHGDIFHSAADRDHMSDTPWTDRELYAPDVVERNGKYYLYAYIVDSKGCVAVADRPEGPFAFIGKYKYSIPADRNRDFCNSGAFIDPGVLADDDGRVYIYCGFLRSFAAELNPENMLEVMAGSYKDDIIPREPPFEFFEACSPRKIGKTYYLIYSPKIGSRLAYATSDSPTGPFKYRGVIIDNGEDYPGGNNHGSICGINGQWYIFYHRTTNGTVMSRRACAERIEILPDGSIPKVEMTSLGFEKALSPYTPVPAEIACVLTGGCMVTEKNTFERTVTNVKSGAVMGYKYFDFGEDYSSKTMEFAVKVKGTGAKSRIRVFADGRNDGLLLGECEIGTGDGIYSSVLKNITGAHSIFLVAEDCFGGPFKGMFEGRSLFELESFVFIK